MANTDVDIDYDPEELIHSINLDLGRDKLCTKGIPVSYLLQRLGDLQTKPRGDLQTKFRFKLCDTVLNILQRLPDRTLICLAGMLGYCNNGEICDICHTIINNHESKWADEDKLKPKIILILENNKNNSREHKSKSEPMYENNPRINNFMPQQRNPYNPYKSHKSFLTSYKTLPICKKRNNCDNIKCEHIHPRQIFCEWGLQGTCRDPHNCEFLHFEIKREMQSPRIISDSNYQNDDDNDNEDMQHQSKQLNNVHFKNDEEDIQHQSKQINHVRFQNEGKVRQQMKIPYEQNMPKQFKQLNKQFRFPNEENVKQPTKFSYEQNKKKEIKQPVSILQNNNKESTRTYRNDNDTDITIDNNNNMPRKSYE